VGLTTPQLPTPTSGYKMADVFLAGNLLLKYRLDALLKAWVFPAILQIGQVYLIL
jgi:hypothetical protein